VECYPEESESVFDEKYLKKLKQRESPSSFKGCCEEIKVKENVNIVQNFEHS
jgi:hypothetical protein